MTKTAPCLLALFFAASAYAQAADDPCASGEAKLVYSSSISFGSRVQLENPRFCAGRRAYAILVQHESDETIDYSRSLCSLYHLGKTMSHEARLVTKERLAVFDNDGRFGGLNNYVSYASMGAGASSLYYAATSLTCETQPDSERL